MAERPHYEISTISRKTVLLGAGTLLAVTVISLIGAVFFWRLWWPVQYTSSPGIEVFQNSRLDPTLSRSRAEREALWAKQANTYAWVDREAGIARIPVARAVELYLESAP
jgi:hypothetical protein